jgi:penicillin-binding protein 1A
MGFTGQYVAGTWFGNDDYSPTNRVTGGNLPAMAWKDFMMFAHATYNIPQIPGLPVHPAQAVEQQRIAALQRIETRLGRGPTAALYRMPERTLESLETIKRLLENASRKPFSDENQPADNSTVPSRSSSLEGPGAETQGQRASLRP